LAAVYSREIDGKVLTLSASGWTYNDTFILYDYETESLWYHRRNENGLRCIAGEYADRHLPELASIKQRWNRWYAQNPNTKYLLCKSIPPGVCAGY
jgi:hypothetical protein